ncbi:MAG: hypothetical protein AMXMBFR77_20890 [Phycisphaerales bacterium]|nr:dockerin type I domain-containing protein [Phycisphaerales bacterium]MDL1904764.1 hypothetical protein [Synechococcales cyanobacterium CNB]GIK19754.1 MAG: hypothetical protein BroJett004_19180 [Planctomycetota bacterium]
MLARLTMAMVASVSAVAFGGDVGTYRVDCLGAGWTGTGINESGEVCGNVSPDGTSVLAGVSRGGLPFELLPLPEGMQTSRAHDINDAGVIVGAVCPNQYVISQPIAAVWRPGAGGYTVEVLGTLPGLPYSAAYAINNLGDIVGGSGYFGWSLTTGTLFGEDGPEALPDGMIGVDVNDGRVVLTGNRLLHLDTGQIVETPLPPGNWQGFVGAALNNLGDFCGYILGYSGCSTFPMRYRQGVGWEFLGGCATTTSATAINDRGDALLYYYMTTSGVHFNPEGYFPLGSLIDPSQGEWYVQYGGGNGINGSRQIVAAARDGATGPICAVLLTPMNPCPADFNGDGVVNTLDLLAFLNVFTAGDASADFNGDGTVNTLDVLAFLNAYAVGC